MSLSSYKDLINNGLITESKEVAFLKNALEGKEKVTNEKVLRYVLQNDKYPSDCDRDILVVLATLYRIDSAKINVLSAVKNGYKLAKEIFIFLARNELLTQERIVQLLKAC